jgi:adenylyltransferase/sulfurtransferase
MQLTDGPILVVGVGGLGCPVSLALAKAGARAVTLLDPDTVELTNLHRQLWHHPDDLGRPKVESAAAKLRAAFPLLQVEAQQGALEAGNAEGLFRRHALVIDATDGVETKFLLSDAAVLTGTPLVYSGVVRFDGLAMRIEPGRGPCLRCLFEEPPVEALTCAQAGVLGSMAGLMGGLQARLAQVNNIAGGFAMLQVVDGLALRFRQVKVGRRDDCAACGGSSKPVLSEARDLTCPTPASTLPKTSAR